MKEALFLGSFVLILGLAQLVVGIISLYKPIKDDHGASTFCLLGSPLSIMLGICWLLTGLGIQI